MDFLNKIPGIGKFIYMLLNSRKFQVVVIGTTASALVKYVGFEEAMAAELSKNIFYGALALAGYIAVEDHGKHQAKKGDGNEGDTSGGDDVRGGGFGV